MKIHCAEKQNSVLVSSFLAFNHEFYESRVFFLLEDCTFFVMQ